MLGLFKRTKIESWEIELLRTVIKQLPSQCINLINQIDDKLLKSVLLNKSDIAGYVAFTYNWDILKKYDKPNEYDYKFTNINIFDIKSFNYVQYEIYVSSGTISGYSLGKINKNNIDFSKIDISNLKKVLLGNIDYNRILPKLNDEEIKIMNPSAIYLVFVNNKEYFHIKDLEDGNFIGIDENKVVYLITHDPIEIKMLNKNIVEITSVS